MLLSSGLDRRLAYHISSLFIRSPLPVFKKDLMFPCCSNKCKTPAEEKSAKEHSPQFAPNLEQIHIQEDSKEYKKPQFLSPGKIKSSS